VLFEDLGVSKNSKDGEKSSVSIRARECRNNLLLGAGMEKIKEDFFIPTFIAFRRGQAMPLRAKDSSGSSEKVLC
jgi:hypothetical protein